MSVRVFPSIESPIAASREFWVKIPPTTGEDTYKRHITIIVYWRISAEACEGFSTDSLDTYTYDVPTGDLLFFNNLHVGPNCGIVQNPDSFSAQRALRDETLSIVILLCWSCKESRLFSGDLTVFRGAG